MKCPYCLFGESKVIDSRPTDEGEKIRRRRECLQCIKRFTTYEIVETTPIMVVKKDRSREAFNREKLRAGLTRSCEKRPVPVDEIDGLVDKIQTGIQNSMDKEVQSSRIGELAMQGLKAIDEVAYVRFASVYREFKDADSFFNELQTIMDLKRHGGKK